MDLHAGKILVITGDHGESWRCQAVWPKTGHRCIYNAVIEGQHPIRKSKMALCTRHGAIAQRPGTELRLDNSAGYTRIFLPVYGGTLDGCEGGCPVPWNLRVGDQWMVDIQGGQLEKYRLDVVQRYGKQPEPYLQYVGPAVPSSAPGAPESGDVPSQ